MAGLDEPGRLARDLRRPERAGHERRRGRRHTTYRLNGRVAPGAPADAAGLAQSQEGLRFSVLDKEDASKRVQVLYRGSVPDQFKEGREVVVTGSIEDGVFVARNDSLITLCPSKFTDRPGDTST